MSAVQERASAAAAAAGFERRERADGTIFVTLTKDAPAWVRRIVQDAHGDMLPDDWRYQTIRDAFYAIANADEDADLDDMRSEFADEADVYNADLLAWVGSHAARAGYVDDARDEYGEPRNFYHSLQMGQYVERGEVFDAVLTGLRETPND